MRNLLVTGGTGLVGRAVCQVLVREGIPVVASSRTGKHNPVVMDVSDDAGRVRDLVQEMHSSADIRSVAEGVQWRPSIDSETRLDELVAWTREHRG